jgi:hypothetical protein
VHVVQDRAASQIDAKRRVGLHRNDEIEGFVAQAHALDAVSQQKLVAEMRTLVKNRSRVEKPPRRSETRPEIGVDEIQRRRIQIEDREDATEARGA